MPISAKCQLPIKLKFDPYVLTVHVLKLLIPIAFIDDLTAKVCATNKANYLDF